MMMDSSVCVDFDDTVLAHHGLGPVIGVNPPSRRRFRVCFGVRTDRWDVDEVEPLSLFLSRMHAWIRKLRSLLFADPKVFLQDVSLLSR